MDKLAKSVQQYIAVGNENAMTDDREKEVAVFRDEIVNYSHAPYNPSQPYPELDSLPYRVKIDPNNSIYGMVRRIFCLYGLDHSNFGTPKWNPLSEVSSKRDVVVIKPNLVRDTHPLGEKAVLSTVTHASLIRPVIDYIILSLQNEGRIIICDAPLQSSDFNKICQINGLNELMSYYKETYVGNIQIMLLDLRKTQNILDKYGVSKKIIPLSGDPLGYTLIDLGKNSYLSEIDEDWEKYAITGYDSNNLRKYQTNRNHCYLISNTVLNADAIVSIPKLKTHERAGITVCLKNFVGINPIKDFLPHHRLGTPMEGGDAYPARPVRSSTMRQNLGNAIIRVPILRDVILFLRRIIAGNEVRMQVRNPGSWEGNDTLWRTILDLNTIIKYADKKGALEVRQRRRFLFLVDGIIGQEGLGPVRGKPKKCGLLLLGKSPCSIDYVAARIMGLNWNLLKQIREAFQKKDATPYPLVKFIAEDVRVVSNVQEYANIHKLRRQGSLEFSVPDGWDSLKSDQFKVERNG